MPLTTRIGFELIFILFVLWECAMRFFAPPFFAPVSTKADIKSIWLWTVPYPLSFTSFAISFSNFSGFLKRLSATWYNFTPISLSSSSKSNFSPFFGCMKVAIPNSYLLLSIKRNACIKNASAPPWSKPPKTCKIFCFFILKSPHKSPSFRLGNC